MFEDSLVESTGRIRTRSKYFAIGSFAVQALLVTALAFYPFLHPATLPKQALTMLLTAPPVPPSPASLPQHAAAPAHPQAIMIDNPLAAPIRIPQPVEMDGNDRAAFGSRHRIRQNGRRDRQRIVQHVRHRLQLRW